MFILLGTKNEKQIKKTIDEIGQMLVTGALDDTKMIGKVGADIFANFGAEKPWKKTQLIKMSSGVFPVFPVDLA